MVILFPLVRRDGKSPDLKVNNKKLQTANLVYIFYDIILSVNASIYESFIHWSKPLTGVQVKTYEQINIWGKFKIWLRESA